MNLSKSMRKMKSILNNDIELNVIKQSVSLERMNISANYTFISTNLFFHYLIDIIVILEFD